MKKRIYKFTIILIIYILVILGAFFYFKFFKNYIPIPACPFYSNFGIMCPSCGSTRATIALLHGDIISSILYNPIIAYIFFATTFYLILELFNIIFKKNFKFHFYLVLTIGICIYILNFILKII